MELIRLRFSAPLGYLFFATFFLALHIFSVIFINSSFLSQFGNTSLVGALYFIGALSGIGALIVAPSILRAIGVFSFTIILAILEIFTILAFGTAHTLLFAAILFICYWVFTVLLLYTLDILIEVSMQGEGETSVVRGFVLTIANAALFFCPIVGGLIIENCGYFLAYALGSIALIPFAFTILLRFRKFSDPEYPRISLRRAFARIGEVPRMRSIFFFHFLLRIFFSATVIYIPLYLQSLGFSWGEVGIILSMMLVPLVLFEFPIGELAQVSDERVLFGVGFLILGSGVAVLAAITGVNIALFGLVLFIAHSGAAILEVSTESAFFKRVGGTDADLISMFRILRPLGYIAAPLAGAILIPAIGYDGYFTMLALLLFVGSAMAFSEPQNAK